MRSIHINFNESIHCVIFNITEFHAKMLLSFYFWKILTTLTVHVDCVIYKVNQIASNYYYLKSVEVINNIFIIYLFI